MSKSVAVITAATSNLQLLDAVEGVAAQTYDNICHHVVCNGAEHYANIKSLALPEGDKLKIARIPDNTAQPDHPHRYHKAKSFYNGHRIYAGYSHFVNSDYVAFLDEDNWYRPDHIASLVEEIEKGDLDFAYSLREFYSQDKEYIAPDNCENLGKWQQIPTYTKADDEPEYYLDTSAYLFTHKFLINVAHLWHWGYIADTRFSNMLFRDKHIKHDTNGRYTLCYRIDSVPTTNRIGGITVKNARQAEKYPDGFPWVKHG